MNLNAQIRERNGSNASRRLRNEGFLPAVVYGGNEPLAIAIKSSDAAQLLGSGERIVDVSIGERREHVLLREVQRDTFGTDVLHLDFMRVNDDQLVTVSVPLEFSGTPKGLIAGGVTEYSRIELPITCPAGLVPKCITVAIDHLGVGKVLHNDEIELPEGIKLAADLDPRGSVVTIRALKKRGGE
jgi:large subunit ribosomal protein L25